LAAPVDRWRPPLCGHRCQSLICPVARHLALKLTQRADRRCVEFLVTILRARQTCPAIGSIHPLLQGPEIP
jgi:hypothetical protein